MTRHKTIAVICVLVVFSLTLPQLPAQATTLEDARRCTDETRRLERLVCFDEVFATPLVVSRNRVESGIDGFDTERSERWHQAYELAETHSVQGEVAYTDTGQDAGLLATVPALGAQPPRPLLALQCHNNITELTLMLPEPLDVERVKLGLGTSQTAVRKAWRVRDDGYVLSIGRGLPAIRAVKATGQQADLRVASANSHIDGLLFDLTGFDQAILPIRERCGW